MWGNVPQKNKSHLKRIKIRNMEKQFSLLEKELLKNFDFKKVHKAMLALEWEWRMGDSTYGIPSKKTIKETARRLLKEAFDRKTTIGTGGFTASYDGETLLLMFVVEEFTAE